MNGLAQDGGRCWTSHRQSAEPQPADERVRQLEAQIAHLTAQLNSARATSPR
jgi:hypothetical protein